MIWDNPWTLCALEPGGTDLPPLPYIHKLPANIQFSCMKLSDLSNDTDAFMEWSQFLPTDTTMANTNTVWIARLTENQSHLVATCCLICVDPKLNLWVLEALKAKKGHGYGSQLLQCVMPWLYANFKRFMLGYTWELSVVGVVCAFVKGWMRSVVDIQYGWASPTKSTLKSTSKSTSKWKRSKHCPGPGWSWTGEFVCVGILNLKKDVNVMEMNLDWVTPDYDV